MGRAGLEQTPVAHKSGNLQESRVLRLLHRGRAGIPRIGQRLALWFHSTRLQVGNRCPSRTRPPLYPGHESAEQSRRGGVGWLYFNHRVKGDCPVEEVFPDVLTYYTTDKAARNLGYLGNCPEIARRAVPDNEAVEVAGSVARVEIPDWFYEHYNEGDRPVNLDDVWSDLRSAKGSRTAAYLMRDMLSTTVAEMW